MTMSLKEFVDSRATLYIEEQTNDYFDDLISRLGELEVVSDRTFKYLNNAITELQKVCQLYLDGHKVDGDFIG